MRSSQIGDLGVVALALTVIVVTLGSWFVHPLLGIVMTVFMGVPTLMAFGAIAGVAMDWLDNGPAERDARKVDK